MSYILDALKKAETERNLGEIPGIHAQPVHFPSRAQEQAWRNHAWRGIAIGCAAILSVLAAWKWLSPEEKPAPQPAPVARIGPAIPEPAAPQAPVAMAAPAQLPITDTVPAESAPKTEKHARREASKTKAKTSSPHPATSAPSIDVPIAMNDLPPAMQREIPLLTIGGYIYSSTPADRSVLINQRLLREGDSITNDLTLESIRSDGVILNYKGRRFKKPY
jgi:general secretion pathway protein B